MKSCNYCGKSIKGDIIYCSKNCRTLGNKVKMQNKFQTISCKHCNNNFTPRQANQIYCSQECSIIHHKEKYNSIRISDFNIFKRDNFRCVYCGKSSIEDNIKLHVDHINPLNRGGKAGIENLITACEACNITKQHSILMPNDLTRLLHEVKRRNKQLLEHQLNSINTEIDTIKKIDMLRLNK